MDSIGVYQWNIVLCVMGLLYHWVDIKWDVLGKGSVKTRAVAKGSTPQGSTVSNPALV